LSDDATVIVRVPMSLKKRGGRKVIVPPPGAETWAPAQRVDGTLIRALVRGFDWRKQIDIGVYQSVRELAAAENIRPSYVGRIMNLTMLAPAIVERILDGNQPRTLYAELISRGIPDDWRDQWRLINE